MSAYRLYVDGERTEYRAKGTSPAKALRDLVAAAGIQMASQDGRYGRADDGRRVSALTEPWGRVDAPDARTTRVGAPR